MSYELQDSQARREGTKSVPNENRFGMENNVKGPINSPKKAHGDSADAVNPEAETFSLVSETKARPFIGVGAAFTTGLVLGKLLGRERSRFANESNGATRAAGIEIFAPLAQILTPEVGIMKKAALTAFVSFTGKKLSEAVPTLSSHIDEIVHRVHERLETM